MFGRNLKFLYPSGWFQLKSFVNQFHLSPSFNMKEIIERKEGNKLVIEGVISDSPRKPFLIKTEHDEHACPLCRLNLDVKHTDVLIISQFVRSDGCMLPRRITGLCKVQHRRMTKLVSMAHIAGLMPNLVPSYSKPNCMENRRLWRRYNTYFDESTIRVSDPFENNFNALKAKYYREQRGIDVKTKKKTIAQSKVFEITGKTVKVKYL